MDLNIFLAKLLTPYFSSNNNHDLLQPEGIGDSNLGRMYALGLGVNEDKKKAIELYKKSVD